MKILRPSIITFLMLTTVAPAQRFGMYLSEKPTVSLEQALPIAHQAASIRFSDLDAKFALHSVKPRSLKNDNRGQHWQFLWQEVPFKSRLRGIVVRVYMKDGSTSIEEFKEP